MAKNLTGQQAGLVRGDQVNDPSVRVIRGKNVFPQSFRHPSTCRYGEIDVVGAIRCERGDVIPYRVETELDTFTLQSPIKSDVFMNTACFKVPMEAIYPRTWRDYQYPNPVKGDDVPADCRAMFSPVAFYNVIKNVITSAKNVGDFDTFVRYTLLLESVFSAGSLFSKFNIHLNAFTFDCGDSRNLSFDRYFNTVFVPLLKSIFFSDSGYDISIVHIDSSDSYSYEVVSDGSPELDIDTPVLYGKQYITFRRALELLRTGLYKISSPDSPTELMSVAIPQVRFAGTSFNSLRLNIEPIVAYKLITSHFFVNSKVDFVYTAQLFRNNMESLLYGDAAVRPSFMFNGVSVLYDVFSENIINYAISSLDTPSDDVLGFWFNLFSWSRSLRYGDYFTGSHVEPLAVGDIETPVTDGSVNSIDLTKKLQLTRFLNKINIVGSRFEDYIRALFGGSIPEAPKDVPIRLSLETSKIEGFEVNNTGTAQADADQNLRTSNLKLTDSKFMFEVAIDEPCWIIATRYFDVERIYSRTCDRFAFHDDRFDDFIPDMQFVGDQDVKNSELEITRPDTPFAYNLRYMEYKNRYSYASGGFIEYLPSWSFITDNKEGQRPSSVITPEYIRSSPSEFDRFYKSFADSYSLGSYFHFITKTTNVLNPYRQMVYAPEILA